MIGTFGSPTRLPYCLGQDRIAESQIEVSEMPQDEDSKIDGRIHGEQFEPSEKDGLLMRLIFMILIAIMISFAQTVLGVVTVIQFVILVINNKQPNERLADFGTDLGIWIAKAARYQTAASNVKPWPWTELD